MKKSTIKSIKEAIQELLSFLSEKNKRTAEIIAERYGLKNGVEKTLEEIGKKYSITRERVRQIEESAMNLLKGIETYNSKFAVEELKKEMALLGHIVPEESISSLFSENTVDQKNISFMFILKEDFFYFKENDGFQACWTTNKSYVLRIQQALDNLTSLIDDRDVLTEERVVSIFRGFLGEMATSVGNKTILDWLSISEEIGKNSLGEWGKITSVYISPSGIADYSYLVLKKNGKPMHFSKIAKAIKSTFHKKANVGTCHNELIKDKRCVLVGQGQYALAEWGHEGGTTLDIIKQILKGHPEGLPCETIMKKVLKKRLAKKSTVFSNLYKEKIFKNIGGRGKDGVYKLVKRK